MLAFIILGILRQVCPPLHQLGIFACEYCKFFWPLYVFNIFSKFFSTSHSQTDIESRLPRVLALQHPWCHSGLSTVPVVHSFFIRTKFIRTPSLKFFEILRTFWRLKSMFEPVLSKKSFLSNFIVSLNLFHSWISVDWNETWCNRLTDYSH